MKAIIMAGGLGTRLRPLTCFVPKPMVPVLNRPILEHTIELLKQHAITELIFLLFYLPDYIKKHFDGGRKFGVNITYICPDQDYGTAGSVKQASHLIDEPCLVISGDALTDLNITEFLQFHQKKKALLTMALAQVGNPSPFGLAMLNKNGRVVRFLEKPTWGQIFSDTVNMGIYVMQPEVLDFIPEDKEYYFAKDLFPKLVKQKRNLYGYVCKGYWQDIGDLKTYQQVHWDWFDKKISLKIEERQKKENLWLGERCTLDEDIQMEGTVVIGEGSHIESGVQLSNVVIGKHCHVKKSAVLEKTILWDRVTVGEDAELHRTVVASGSQIGSGAYLDEDVYVSNNCVIGEKSKIQTGVKIWPEKLVYPGSLVNSSLVWGEKWQRELFTDARVTGLTNFEISPEFGAKLGTAFGTWLSQGNTVVMSRDITTEARMINRAMISGLMSAGIQVYDLQVTAIPIVRYSLSSGLHGGGVHIRRSPFDKKLLDILFFDRHGRDLPASATKAVERIYFREDFPRVPYKDIGDIDFPVRVTESYEQDFLSKIDRQVLRRAKFTVTIDYSFGVATTVFPAILGHLDLDVISLNAFLQPEKLTRTARGFTRALQQLARIVSSTRSDVGFLLDAGAEKIFCVDEKGRILSGERLAVLITHLFFQVYQPKKIAAPVSIPIQIEKMCQERGIQLVFTGDHGGSLIQATADSQVKFAVETQGGFIFTDFHFAFDGMFSIVKILELMAKTGKRLGELHDSLPISYLLRTSIPCPWEAKGKIMRRMTEYSENKTRLLEDGVKIYQNDSWILILPDREKPFCHILTEANTENKAQKLLHSYQTLITNWIDQ